MLIRLGPSLNFLGSKIIGSFMFNLAALSTINFGDKTLCIGKLLTLEIRQTQS